MNNLAPPLGVREPGGARGGPGGAALGAGAAARPGAAPLSAGGCELLRSGRDGVFSSIGQI